MSPYPFGTPEHEDYESWHLGFRMGGGELDFLRALHSPSRVHALASYLRLRFPQYSIRLSSFWIDKFPQAFPVDILNPLNGFLPSRELGDLGIVVRAVKGETVYIRFWILQGKVDHPNWHSAGSSDKEIELYETCPDFDLYTNYSKKNRLGNGRFRLASSACFNAPPHGAFPFWNYLMFQPQWPPAAFTPGKLPIQHVWDHHGGKTLSFTAGIERMVQDVEQTSYGHGAPVGPTSIYKDWQRLYRTIWARSSRPYKVGGLSGGPWETTAFLADLASPFGSWVEVGDAVAGSTGFGGRHHASFARTRQFDEFMFEHDLDDEERRIENPPPNQTLDQGGDGDDDGGGLSLMIVDLIDDSVEN